MKTIAHAAQAALLVQNACNLSGVVRSFATVTTVLWAEADRLGEGTDWVNRHPVSILFATQISFLTGIYAEANGEPYHSASVECERLSKEGE